MITITLKAFYFLRPRLAAEHAGYSDAATEIEEGTTVAGLIAKCGLAEHDVEAVFLNGKIVSWDETLDHSDRVALVPPGGTPGPYRVLLGIRKLPQS